MPISKVHSSNGGNNTGSSSALADYLEKENAELDLKSLRPVYVLLLALGRVQPALRFLKHYPT